jgi:acetyltransferase-like isoleucine patch superfamily enzyme
MFKKYGLLGSIYLFVCIIRSKIINRKIRLIRFPIDLRCINQIDFGKGLTTGRNCRIEAHSFSKSDKLVKIFFGSNIQMNDNVHISACKKVVIGDNVLIASKVFISDSSHGNYGNFESMSSPNTAPASRFLYTNEVNIGDNCWIGENVCILKGVNIGTGSVIGANSVVISDIPEYSIAVGSPARIIKKYSLKTNNWESL